MRIRVFLVVFLALSSLLIFSFASGFGLGIESFACSQCEAKCRNINDFDCIAGCSNLEMSAPGGVPIYDKDKEEYNECLPFSEIGISAPVGLGALVPYSNMYYSSKLEKSKPGELCLTEIQHQDETGCSCEVGFYDEDGKYSEFSENDVLKCRQYEQSGKYSYVWYDCDWRANFTKGGFFDDNKKCVMSGAYSVSLSKGITGEPDGYFGGLIEGSQCWDDVSHRYYAQIPYTTNPNKGFAQKNYEGEMECNFCNMPAESSGQALDSSYIYLCGDDDELGKICVYKKEGNEADSRKYPVCTDLGKDKSKLIVGVKKEESMSLGSGRSRYPVFEFYLFDNEIRGKFEYISFECEAHPITGDSICSQIRKEEEFMSLAFLNRNGTISIPTLQGINIGYGKIPSRASEYNGKKAVSAGEILNCIISYIDKGNRGKGGTCSNLASEIKDEI